VFFYRYTAAVVFNGDRFIGMKDKGDVVAVAGHGLIQRCCRLFRILGDEGPSGRCCRYTCPACGEPELKELGAGTERIEAELRTHFPEARIARMDSDTTGGKDGHNRILSRVARGEVDILVGTQMIAKGLDLPLVTLVGAVLTDISLNLPDFRAAERTFQLLTQVAGRAGRSPLGGKSSFRPFSQTSMPSRQLPGMTWKDFPRKN